MSVPLDFARADVGLSSEGGRFQGPPVERFALPGEPALAWCARACRTWFTLAGGTLPGDPYAIGSVAALHAALDDAGMLVDPDEEPKPNDLILLLGTAGNRDGMLIGGHHVGLVESVTPDTVTSIDGDWGTPDRVQRVVRDRNASDIWAYGRAWSGGSAGSVVVKGALVAGAVVGARALYRAWQRRRGGA